MGIIEDGQAAQVAPALFGQEESRGRMLVERVAAAVEHARRIERHWGHPLWRVCVEAEGQAKKAAGKIAAGGVDVQDVHKISIALIGGSTRDDGSQPGMLVCGYPLTSSGAPRVSGRPTLAPACKRR